MSTFTNLMRSAALAALCFTVTVANAAVTDVPKHTPDRYSADQAFYAVVLTPQTFCRLLRQPYVTRGPGCGGMIVHDHKEGPASPTAFQGANGANFIGIPDSWWAAVQSGRISAAYLQIIVAHEEGHLRCGHHLGQPSAANEIIADRFAGAAMRWLWADTSRYSNDQIAAWVNEAYGSLVADTIHASSTERIKTFIGGFQHPETATCTL